MGNAKVIKLELPMEESVCNACGVTFSYPKQLDNSFRETHKTFYCPNGHGLVYNSESKQDKINKYVKALQRIAELETGVFNKHTLELAIEIAQSAIK